MKQLDKIGLSFCYLLFPFAVFLTGYKSLLFAKSMSLYWSVFQQYIYIIFMVIAATCFFGLVAFILSKVVNIWMK